MLMIQTYVSNSCVIKSTPYSVTVFACIYIEVIFLNNIFLGCLIDEPWMDEIVTVVLESEFVSPKAVGGIIG